MLEKIWASVEQLPLEDLLKLKKNLDNLINTGKPSTETALHQRKNSRARVKIAGTAEIEREAEFFYKTHKITIHEMSVNGLLFTVPATVIENDILIVSFRNPSTGEKKNINCQATRVKEIPASTGIQYEVAAQAVDRKTVIAYREMLKNRGK